MAAVVSAASGLVRATPEITGCTVIAAGVVRLQFSVGLAGCYLATALNAASGGSITAVRVFPDYTQVSVFFFDAAGGANTNGVGEIMAFCPS